MKSLSVMHLDIPYHGQESISDCFYRLDINTLIFFFKIVIFIFFRKRHI